ncbi:hypothetical protein AB4455_07825 [Vibrio sp. 10N.261.46.E12]|uniref:hypothetical protein n=1 Tax=unclassified Vibrio TaxID=2614977 RepID=UPI0009787FE9|nr:MULTISPECIES: hypothetical protein [unclassified Vibrio]OMO34449.1 hypothetical protein BH584_12540 [Vibrio sp. 10N.261.45.E1]PMJ26228.1 hypothetical protein BCU27_09745 [Vibrio sp. 10N.286.45.B6]PML82778.1 hypothetical protein BCT66_20020 [Vibrio sp. 10N.261.49.E11]PMM90302.1 hypothetical protein BCT46_23445 [Vibrio sp. 10N.261.46.E8]PMN43922.1 hypothetical protein BCT32_00725 [Vibrio sp. 10N.261.45.E11]
MASSKTLKHGGLQLLSREITQKHNLSLSMLLLIEAVQDGATFLEISKLYGLEAKSSRDFQFLSDSIKLANRRSRLDVFIVTSLSNKELEDLGIPNSPGRNPRWISLSSYGRTILEDIENTLYE